MIHSHCALLATWAIGEAVYLLAMVWFRHGEACKTLNTLSIKMYILLFVF